MRENSKKRKTIIMFLCFLVFCMAIAYTIFMQKLNIDGASQITSNWDVRIVDIKSNEIVGGATNKSAPTFNVLTASFSTLLVSPKDSITYDIVVENRGNIDAVLDKIDYSDTSNPAIVFTSSGLKEGDFLPASSSATLKVRVEYSDLTESQPSNVISNLTVKLDFKQGKSSVSPFSNRRTNLAKALISEVTDSGDGLYVDPVTVGRYVYRGDNPDNYIKFDNNMYRIISVESDGTLKIIKNSSIGDMVYDLPYTNGSLGLSLNGTRYFDSNLYYCHYDNYSGCNIWGSDKTMLDVDGNHILNAEVNGARLHLPDTESYINSYLNNEFYNSIDKNYREYINKHTWNVGSVSYNNLQKIDGDVREESLYKWRGNIGLVSVTDYVKASLNTLCASVYTYHSDSNCYNDAHNWLYSNNTWTMTRISGASNLWFISNNLKADLASSNYAIRPVLYLNADLGLFGKGTADNPYVIG